MKGLNRFFYLAYIVILTFSGVFILFNSVGLYELRPLVMLWIRKLLSFPMGFWFGFGLVIINLGLLLLQSFTYQGIRNISFDNPEGEVSISAKAVEDFVEKICREIDSVVKVTPYILPYKDGVKIRLRLAVKTDVNLPDLTGMLQQTVKEKVQGILGIDNVKVVEIEVNKLVPKTNNRKDIEDNTFAIPTPGNLE